MTATYLTPYGKNPYGRLKGEKQEAFIKVDYAICKIIKDENAYWIIGNMNELKGVVASYKPELPIEPDLFALSIYGDEYEIVSKNADGKYDTSKHQPSKFEKALYDLIAGSESTWIGEDKYFTGSVNLLPDMMLEGADEDTIFTYIDGNISLIQAQTKKDFPELPLYSSKSNYSKGGKSYGLKPDEKVAFLIKQMTEDIKHVDWKSGKTLAELTDRMILEHHDTPNFIELYFQMLIACVR